LRNFFRLESIAGLWQDKRAVPEMFAEPSQPFGTYYLRMPLRETVLLVLMREDELMAFRNYFRWMVTIEKCLINRRNASFVCYYDILPFVDVDPQTFYVLVFMVL